MNPTTNQVRFDALLGARWRKPPISNMMASVTLDTPVPWSRALITLSGARAAYIGPGLNLEPHRNTVATLVIALESPFWLTLSGPAASRTIALIPPNTLHHVRATGAMAFVYLDPLGDDYTGLQTADVEALHMRVTTGSQETIAARVSSVRALCDALGIQRRPLGDIRIGAVIRRLDAHPQEFHGVSDTARTAGLSTSRFQVLFRRATGVTFARYRLWRRMGVVFRALNEGQNLTTAAFEAGFSSSAHLSASFKAMFGLSPSALVATNARLDLEHGSEMTEAGL